jgi:hypothetical protein
MRNWVAVLAAAVVVAGCSQTFGGESQPSKLTPLPSPSARPTATTSAPPAAAPAPDTPIDKVITWIQAGAPADAAAFHTATRDGTENRLGDDVAFVTPSGKTKCMTDSQYSGGAMACLVKLVNPPPRPPDFPTAWVAGWVDFDGQSVSVGSPHGDPGPFVNGDGRALPYGQTLKFGDYQCRSDEAGVYCANFAHQSAVRFSDGGIIAFGCAKQVTPPADIGEKFVC